MIGMKKGLFGKSMAPGGMPEAYSMPQAGTMQDGANLGASGAMQQERPGIGTRLLGQGWEGKAAALGSMLMGNPFAVQQYQGQQDQQRQRAAMMAEQQRQQAQMMAAAQGMGIDPQQAALLGQEGLRSYTLDKLKGPDTPAPDTFDRALMGANIDPKSPEGIEMYRRRAASMTRDPNDEFVVVPIPGRGTYAGPRSGMPAVFGQGQQSSTSVPQSDWDSAKPMGGAGGNASGSF